MNKRFIRRITQLNKSLLGLSWVGFANLGGQAPQTPLFNQKEQGYNLLKWCPVKWGNRSLSPLLSPLFLSPLFPNKSTLTPHITGSKKQSEERAALFAVRVNVIVSCYFGMPFLLGLRNHSDTLSINDHTSLELGFMKSGEQGSSPIFSNISTSQSGP